jgi:hypothetical protein
MQYLKKIIRQYFIWTFIVLAAALIIVLLEFPLSQWPIESIKALKTGSWRLLIPGLLIPSVFFIFEFGQDDKPVTKEEKYVFKFGLGVKLLFGVVLFLPFMLLIIGYIMGFVLGDTSFQVNINGGYISHIIVLLIILLMANLGLNPQIYELVLNDRKIWHRGFFYRWHSRTVETLTSYNKDAYGYTLTFDDEKPLTAPRYLKGETALLELLDAQIEKNTNA